MKKRMNGIWQKFVYETSDGQKFEFKSEREMLDFIVVQVLGDSWQKEIEINGKWHKVVYPKVD